MADFAATTATTDENGKLKGFVKSDTFNAADGATYTVVVKEGATTVASSTLAPVKRHKGFGHGRKHKHATTSTAGFHKRARGAQDGARGGDCNKADKDRRATAKA